MNLMSINLDEAICKSALLRGIEFRLSGNGRKPRNGSDAEDVPGYWYVQSHAEVNDALKPQREEL